MIALLALATLSPDDGGIEAVSKAADTCDRAAMSQAWTAEVKRHSGFLIEAFDQHRAIVAARAELAERRRKLRTGMPALRDTDAVLKLAEAELDDRQRALDDSAALDRMQADAIGYFRQIYVSQCGGKRL